MKKLFPRKLTPPARLCSCGTAIPKKGAQLSGYPNSNQGQHIHYPNCSKIAAQFVNPKET